MGDADRSRAETDALRDLQQAIEHVDRAHGELVGFHHHVGAAMDAFADAERDLREAGHEAFADALRDDVLPAGVVGDQWTYELLESFRSGFLADVTSLEETIRENLAKGRRHHVERELQREYRERADSDES